MSMSTPDADTNDRTGLFFAEVWLATRRELLTIALPVPLHDVFTALTDDKLDAEAFHQRTGVMPRFLRAVARIDGDHFYFSGVCLRLSEVLYIATHVSKTHPMYRAGLQQIGAPVEEDDYKPMIARVLHRDAWFSALFYGTPDPRRSMPPPETVGPAKFVRLGHVLLNMLHISALLVAQSTHAEHEAVAQRVAARL